MLDKSVNLAFLLTPKKEVEYLYGDYSIRQALEKMEFHKYTTIPVIDKATGKYLYSIAEGDILWYLKDHKLPWEVLERETISAISPSRRYEAVSIDLEPESLESLIIGQNYVPVTDDKGVFIGMVTRRAVINFLLKR